MTNKVKRTITISSESDYEIHRLAALWGVSVTRARERCYHYTAADYFRDRRRGELSGKEVATLRQAEATVEMLKRAT